MIQQQQQLVSYDPSSIYSNKNRFSIFTLIPNKGLVTISGNKSSFFFVYGYVNIVDKSEQYYVQGFQHLNHIYNAEVQDKLNQTTFKGTLTNYLYQGYGSLKDLKKKKEYRGYFDQGEKLGYFEVIDLENKGKKADLEFFDEKGQLQLEKDADDFSFKFDKIKQQLIDQRQEFYYQNLTKIVYDYVQETQKMKDEIFNESNQILPFMKNLGDFIIANKRVHSIFDGKSVILQDQKKQEFTNVLDLQEDKKLKGYFLESLEKGEYFNVEQFNLSKVGIDDQDFEIILKMIENNKAYSVKQINLSRNLITDKSLRAFIVRINRLKLDNQLKIDWSNNLIEGKLNLDSCKIGDSGFQYILDLQNSRNQICELNLSNNNIGKEGCQYIEDILKSNQIKKLDLKNNNIGKSGCFYIGDGLKFCRQLTHFDLAQNNIGKEGCQFIAEGLKSCNQLEDLDLRINQIGNQGCQFLASALKFCNLLTSINLSSNKIDKEGSQFISSILKSCTLITDLFLNNNDVGKEGCLNIADGLKSCKQLNCFAIADNDIEIQGCKCIIDVLKLCEKLRIVGLGSNKIGQESCQYIFDGLKQCKQITAIILTNNNLGNDCCQYIEDGLKSWNYITDLYIEGNNIDNHAFKRLQEKYPYIIFIKHRD